MGADALLAAVVVMTLASVACALTPTVGLMMVARLVQGFAGGWAMVIGRRWSSTWPPAPDSSGCST